MNDKTPTQVNYKETPYEYSEWEILGTYHKEQIFYPLTLDIINNDKLVVDPIFADYGGITHNSEKYLHLPEEEAFNFEKYEEKDIASDIEKIKEEELKLRQEEVEKAKIEYYEKGKNEAILEAKKEKELLENKFYSEIQTTLEDLKNQVKNHNETLEKEALNLSIAIAKKVLDQEIKMNPQYIVSIISKTLKNMEGTKIHEIKVSPESYDFLINLNLKEIFNIGEESWNLVKDDSIKKGCVLETSAGEVNFNLDDTWNRVINELIK